MGALSKAKLQASKAKSSCSSSSQQNTKRQRKEVRKQEMCVECGEYVSDLKQHLQQRHGHVCPFCNKRFGNKLGWHNHVRDYHKANPKQLAKAKIDDWLLSNERSRSCGKNLLLCPKVSNSSSNGRNSSSSKMLSRNNSTGSAGSAAEDQYRRGRNMMMSSTQGGSTGKKRRSLSCGDKMNGAGTNMVQDENRDNNYSSRTTSSLFGAAPSSPSSRTGARAGPSHPSHPDQHLRGGAGGGSSSSSSNMISAGRNKENKKPPGGRQRRKLTRQASVFCQYANTVGAESGEDSNSFVRQQVKRENLYNGSATTGAGSSCASSSSSARIFSTTDQTQQGPLFRAATTGGVVGNSTSFDAFHSRGGATQGPMFPLQGNNFLHPNSLSGPPMKYYPNNPPPAGTVNLLDPPDLQQLFGAAGSSFNQGGAFGTGGAGAANNLQHAGVITPKSTTSCHFMQDTEFFSQQSHGCSSSSGISSKLLRSVSAGCPSSCTTTTTSSLFEQCLSSATRSHIGNVVEEELSNGSLFLQHTRSVEGSYTSFPAAGGSSAGGAGYDTTTGSFAPAGGTSSAGAPPALL
ncbi:unnamed protein product [Amoebophrya sp. A120]|nr:unnamed protein product [Amoebophrya sp. A120]|eukprot:GSA120T00005856001.1